MLWSRYDIRDQQALSITSLCPMIGANSIQMGREEERENVIIPKQSNDNLGVVSITDSYL